ncbi:hypothetical protein Q9G90_00040 [Corynebacterium stationis]|uniref:hypothetical protein n=1 Tax=Corynebacterium stationis TaxID=1705 RepID=UPI00273C270A|nr:hypothetical protein [Corynebacterium stationis]WLP87114.1 hypothetical protein Q9G90_00040 [Corynebacterium stationis]
MITGFSSISNFVLAIAIARAGTIQDVANFAIGFAGFVIVSGLSRALIGEPASARLLSIEQLRAGGQQVSGYSILLAVSVGIVGAITGQTYLLAVGIFGHAIALYDYSKLISTVFGNPYIATILEILRTIIIVASVFVPFINQAPSRLFLFWLIATGVVGMAGILIQQVKLLPAFSHPEIPFRESVSYAFDYILGSGTTQITTFALGAFATPAVNASIRGAGTLFGPITMIATSVRALVLPFLSRGLRRGSKLSPSVNVTATLLLSALPLLIIVNLIPAHWGHGLLGETWVVAKAVLPILSIEVVTTMLTTVPFAGHRSIGAHKRVFNVRLVLAAIRLAVVIAAGVYGGHIWAAIAMVFTSALGLVVWWISYIRLMKSHTANE